MNLDDISKIFNAKELSAIIINLLDSVDNSIEELIEETIKITEIPAPPFQEVRRAEYLFRKFKEIGLQTEFDQLGNVLGTFQSISDDTIHLDQPIIFSAHIDTVFSDNVEIKVIREEIGEKILLKAPGVGDDSRGLAVLIYLAKTIKLLLDETNKDLFNHVLFVATLGEEGIGDLRGVKHLFKKEGYAENCSSFITIDGTGNGRIVNQGIGSLRYRVLYRGPGGHSYGAFGQVNPAYCLGEMMHEISKIKVLSNPKTTYNVGIIGGGTSINSIPDEVFAEIDLRSEDNDSLIALLQEFKDICEKSMKNENSRARDGVIKLDIIKIGERPSGKTIADSEILRNIDISNNYFGIPTEWISSSTDANIPTSIGIPSICISSIDDAGRAHSLDEWIDAGQGSLMTVKRNLLFLIIMMVKK
jgi:acetylornithine deacetylase/succinyl-diaminopimelate desuccinylase-like protein